MSELPALLASAAALRRQQRAFLLATVVNTRGSAYRRPGARLILDESGATAGSVSAGCLEADLARRGWWRTSGRAAVLLTYDANAEDELGWGLGVGCNGVIELMLERVAPDAPDPLAFHAACLAAERPGVLATLHHAGSSAAPFSRLSLDAGGEVVTTLPGGEARDWLLAEARDALRRGHTRPASSPDGALRALIEVIAPPPALFLFGTHPDAVPVAALARSLGWRVAVCAPQERWETRQRFADVETPLLRQPDEIRAAVDACHQPAAVVMNHDVDRDRLVLGALLRSKARYIGVLGPRRRTDQMLDDLARAAPVPLRDRQRIHAPIGLAIGAETPHEIALAIVAEVKATLSGASGCFLRDQPTIHATPTAAAEAPATAPAARAAE